MKLGEEFLGVFIDRTGWEHGIWWLKTEDGEEGLYSDGGPAHTLLPVDLRSIHEGYPSDWAWGVW